MSILAALACSSPAPSPPAPVTERPAPSTQAPNGRPPPPPPYPRHAGATPPGGADPEPGPEAHVQRLNARDGEGQRPRLTIGPSGRIHVAWYERTRAVRYRASADGSAWDPEELVVPGSDYAMGPDVIELEDGRVLLAYDRLDNDGARTGYGAMRLRSDGRWGEAELITAHQREVSGGRISGGRRDGLLYVYLGVPDRQGSVLQAWWTASSGQGWTTAAALTDGSTRPSHPSVSPGSAGTTWLTWDEGPGGPTNAVRLAAFDGRRVGPPETLSPDGQGGERPFVAEREPGEVVVTWFQESLRVLIRRGHPGAWGEVESPSKGLSGFHYLPAIASSRQGVTCVVWGWDTMQTSAILYSLDRGDGWEQAKRLATLPTGTAVNPSVAAGDDGSFHVAWSQALMDGGDVYYGRIER